MVLVDSNIILDIFTEDRTGFLVPQLYCKIWLKNIVFLLTLLFIQKSLFL